MSHSDASDNFEEDGVCQPGNENTGRWTTDEHRLFLKGLELYGKGWKQIATLIQTRTVVQIRTHAQKYFQKLSKVQASGTSNLDPATVMTTMDGGKPRPAAIIARNLRSSTIVTNAAESELRLRSLCKRRNRGRNPRNDFDQYSDDDSSSRSSHRRSRSNSNGSSESSQDDSESQDEDDGDTGEERHGRKDIMKQQQQTEPAGGNNTDRYGVCTIPSSSPSSPLSSRSPSSSSPSSLSSSSRNGAGKTAGDGGGRRRRAADSNGRPIPSKPLKARGREGGAADARALAWEAAARKAETAKTEATAVEIAGTKRGSTNSIGGRSKTRNTSHDLSISGTLEDLMRVGGPEGTRISPTSVSDINFMPFPVPQTEYSDVAMHHLPPQLTPSWCTKPQDNWMSIAGFDVGVDSDDAGPFRWFIDERSLSAPGAFFQPPSETWSDSDTTDVSVSGGACSGGESMHEDFRAIVPEQPPVSTNKVNMSPSNHKSGMDIDNDNSASLDNADISCPTKRRCFNSAMPSHDEDLQCSSTDAHISDAAMANEVNRHVEGDADGLDITSGLWLDHPQESSSLMCGLDLSTPSVSGPGGSLSLPSLDEDEVLGFLSCEENRPTGMVQM